MMTAAMLPARIARAAPEELAAIANDAVALLVADGADALRAALPVDELAAAVQGRLGDSPVGTLGLAAIVNLVECLGLALPGVPLSTFTPRLSQLPTHPNAVDVTSHWHRALAAIALDDLRTWCAIARLEPATRATAEFEAGAKFEFNLQALVGHLGLAVERHHPRRDVRAAVDDLVACFDMLVSVRSVDPVTLLWLARVVHHQLGGAPLATVATDARITRRAIVRRATLGWIERHPDPACQALIAGGDRQLLAQDPAGARASFAAALTGLAKLAEPDGYQLAGATRGLAQARLELGEHDRQIIAACEQVEAFWPANAGVFTMLAKAHRTFGECEEAVAYEARSLACGLVDDDVSFYNMACDLARLGHFPEALAMLERAAALQPSSFADAASDPDFAAMLAWPPLRARLADRSPELGST